VSIVSAIVAWPRRAWITFGLRLAAMSTECGRSRNSVSDIIIGFIAAIHIIWILGIIALVIGVVLALLGMAGHAVGGRRHYF
jgi:hypothetical protein